MTSLGFGLEVPKSKRGEGTATVGDDGEIKTLCPRSSSTHERRSRGFEALAICGEDGMEGSSLGVHGHGRQ